MRRFLVALFSFLSFLSSPPYPDDRAARIALACPRDHHRRISEERKSWAMSCVRFHLRQREKEREKERGGGVGRQKERERGEFAFYRADGRPMSLDAPLPHRSARKNLSANVGRGYVGEPSLSRFLGFFPLTSFLFLSFFLSFSLSRF